MLQRAMPGAAIVSVARPLYEAVSYLYGLLDQPNPGLWQAQDGKMLQDVRGILLARDSGFFERTFRRAVDSIGSNRVLVNDDCRRPMYPVLRDMGFSFVWVHGSHLSRRADTSDGTYRSVDDDVVDRGVCDHQLDNRGTLADLLMNVEALAHTFQTWGT